jgi:hypothetical protein
MAACSGQNDNTIYGVYARPERKVQGGARGRMDDYLDAHGCRAAEVLGSLSELGFNSLTCNLKNTLLMSSTSCQTRRPRDQEPRRRSELGSPARGEVNRACCARGAPGLVPPVNKATVHSR